MKISFQSEIYHIFDKKQVSRKLSAAGDFPFQISRRDEEILPPSRLVGRAALDTAGWRTGAADTDEYSRDDYIHIPARGDAMPPFYIILFSASRLMISRWLAIPHAWRHNTGHNERAVIIRRCRALS